MIHHKKSGIPLQDGLIERSSLLAKMSGALNYPLIMLSAPAGCGKTALAIQIAQTIPADVVWHTITPYQQDLRVFYKALLQNLQTILPDILSLQSILQQPYDHIAHEICAYLEEYVTQELVIIVDDWHLLQNPDADRWLEIMVESLPAKCHVFIVTRKRPALNMILLLGNRQLLHIAQQDLFFTESEVYMLAVKMNQQALPTDKIQTIWSRMHGWPVGTILALQPMSDLLDSHTLGSIEPSETLFQSIASAMLSQQLPDIQHFLKWTSTGEYFNAELCEEVYNISDWEFLLSEVMQNNLFVSQQEGGYRYHQLFRTFLQTHFKLSQPDQYQSAHRRLAGWYQSHDFPDQAIHHYIQSDSVDSAAQLIETLVYAYYAQGRIDTITQFSQQLQDYDKSMPHLDHIQGQIHMQNEHDLEKASLYVNRSIDYFIAHDQPQDAYDVMITLGSIYQLQGEHLSARALFEQILEQDDLPETLRGNALNQLGMTEYYLGELELAVQYLKESLTITQANGGLFTLAKLYQDLELVYRDVGDIQTANDCLEKQIQLWRQLNNPEPLAMALNNLGYRHYEQGLYSLAEKTYQQGLEIITNLQYTRTQYYLLASLGDLERDRGQYGQARSTYQRALNLIDRQEPYAHAEVLTNLSTLYRWQSKHEAAITCANDAIDIAKTHQLQQRHLLAQIEHWHIRLQPWSLPDIKSEIKQMIEIYPRLATNRMIEFIILQLRMAIIESNNTLIHSLLRSLSRKSQKGESIQPFVAELVHAPVLKQFWNHHRHRYPQLQIEVERRQQRAPANNRILQLATTTHSLHLFTLGVERIRRNNRYLKFSEGYTDLGREFLYYFIFNGASTWEEAAQVFWQNKSAEAQRDNFHQTRARVRAALGSEIIVFDDITKKYAVNSEIHLWCDAIQLDSLVSEARRLSFFNKRAFNLWYQATQLTYGPFLQDFDREWINVSRNHYHQLSIEAWMGLGDCHRHQADYRSAQSAYEKVAEFAPYHEAAYRARMECYNALGEHGSISIIYKGLEDRLSHDLNIQPSPQTQQLYRQLVSSAS